MPFKVARYLKCYRSVCNGDGRAEPLCLPTPCSPTPIHLSAWFTYLELTHPQVPPILPLRSFYLPSRLPPLFQPLTSSIPSLLAMALFSSFKARSFFSRFRAKKVSAADASRDGNSGVAGTGKTSCKDLACNSDSSTRFSLDLGHRPQWFATITNFQTTSSF